MRPGTRVQRFTIDRCDARSGDELHAPEGPIGTVIEYDTARPYLPKIVIRWDTGRMETVEAGDEDVDRFFDDVTPRLYGTAAMAAPRKAVGTTTPLPQ